MCKNKVQLELASLNCYLFAGRVFTFVKCCLMKILNVKCHFNQFNILKINKAKQC